MQAIYNIAEICYQKGLNEAVLSPGSRCAPLTLALVRHKGIKTRTISDERAAAFTALGIAQQTCKPSILLCTSGTAVYNYAPAVAEAFFQHIPLLILTADRPQEWIAQQDGQTIFQENIFGKHVKKSYSLPADYSHPDSKWFIERTVNEAINLSQRYPAGPVHINVPLREPLYSETPISFDTSVKIFETLPSRPSLTTPAREGLMKILASAGKVLIIAGQHQENSILKSRLAKISRECRIPVIADIISNLHGEDFIQNHDLFLSNTITDQLKPNVLITFGQSVISKSLKTFLRNNKPGIHFHIDPAAQAADTFQSLTGIVEEFPEDFFNAFDNSYTNSESFYQFWKDLSVKGNTVLTNFLHQQKSFSELELTHTILEELPDNSDLHLANSMPVRYANIIGLRNKFIRVFANRGTSGIDGVISTAYGGALVSGKITTVLTGDLSFFYDRNAWWNNYRPDNLKIILFNNHGGNIFRIIDGPGKQAELDEYFETIQKQSAENTAKDFNLNYFFCNSTSKLMEGLKNLYSTPDPAILEIETSGKINAEVFAEFNHFLKSNF
ncbi:MAG: 2-succinyl-5-enolpyruvyl-6-hydroxy-3-cyclohexene-1-carboxylic-acid synthase [Cytophagaceae bacterium]